MHEQDQYGKYVRLAGTLFFTFLGFILVAILVMLGLRFFFGLLSYIPGITSAFTFFIISVPAALFISINLIYIRRTKTHPSLPVRMISYFLFTVALAAWAYFFTKDLVLFFKHFSATVGSYMSYDMIFLSANVLCIFVVGIIQALSLKKEPDWMDRKRN